MHFFQWHVGVDAPCCEGKMFFVPKAVFSIVPSRTNVKRTSFKGFLELASCWEGKIVLFSHKLRFHENAQPHESHTVASHTRFKGFGSGRNHVVEDAPFRCKGVLLSRAGRPSSGNSREHVHCQNSTSGWVRWGGAGWVGVGREGFPRRSPGVSRLSRPKRLFILAVFRPTRHAPYSSIGSTVASGAEIAGSIPTGALPCHLWHGKERCPRMSVLRHCLVRCGLHCHKQWRLKGLGILFDHLPLLVPTALELTSSKPH